MEITINKIGLSILIIFSSFAIASCKREIKADIAQDSILVKKQELLKEYALCNCVSLASNKDTVVNNDISLAIYREITDYTDLKVYKIIDSISKNAADSIHPSIIADYGDKKPILLDCITFYKSKKLDSLVKTFNVTIDNNK